MLNSSSQVNYRLLLKFCIDYFKPSSPRILVIIAEKATKLKVYAVIQKQPQNFDVLYSSDLTEVPDERICCGNADMEVLCFINRPILDVPIEILKPKTRVLKAEFSTISLSVDVHIDFNHVYRDSYDNNYPEVGGHTPSDVELMFYFALNSSNLFSPNIFIGETIAILWQQDNNVLVYIFRRLPNIFLFETHVSVPVGTKLDKSTLKYPSKISYIYKRGAQLPIESPFNTVYRNNATRNNGLKFYEKIKIKQALGISATAEYLKVMDDLNKALTVQAVPRILSITAPAVRAVIELRIDNPEDGHYFQVSAYQDNKLIASYPTSQTWAPLYISFRKKILRLGEKAFEDYQHAPENVIFDILSVCGKTYNNQPLISPKWGFKIAALEIVLTPN